MLPHNNQSYEYCWLHISCCLQQAATSSSPHLILQLHLHLHHTSSTNTTSTPPPPAPLHLLFSTSVPPPQPPTPPPRLHRPLLQPQHTPIAAPPPPSHLYSTTTSTSTTTTLPSPYVPPSHIPPPGSSPGSLSVTGAGEESYALIMFLYLSWLELSLTNRFLYYIYIIYRSSPKDP